MTSIPTGIPDLGAIGRPQQIQVVPSTLMRSMPGAPAAFVDAETLVEMIRAVVREELDRE